MTQRTWVILGATSIIAEHFAHVVAQAGHNLRLVGRQAEQLELIAKDIQLRYSVQCEVLIIDLAENTEDIFTVLNKNTNELDLFIAQSDFTDNTHLNPQTIKQLITVNIQTNILLINAYLKQEQSQHNLMYLSSVEACRGRSKNSLYGASKAAVEIYLQGLQQAASSTQQISIARLGFIDTKQTYGVPGIFYAGSPKTCAYLCWNALKKRKRMIYYPSFWKFIMQIINKIPFFIYRRMSGI